MNKHLYFGQHHCMIKVKNAYNPIIRITMEEPTVFTLIEGSLTSLLSSLIAFSAASDTTKRVSRARTMLKSFTSWFSLRPSQFNGIFIVASKDASWLAKRELSSSSCFLNCRCHGGGAWTGADHLDFCYEILWRSVSFGHASSQTKIGT